MAEHLAAFVEAVDAVDPTLLGQLLSDVDPDVVRQTWRDRLIGSQDERMAARLLVDRAPAFWTLRHGSRGRLATRSQPGSRRQRVVRRTG
jgi:hypothetical protein